MNFEPNGEFDISQLPSGKREAFARFQQIEASLKRLDPEILASFNEQILRKMRTREYVPASELAAKSKTFADATWRYNVLNLARKMEKSTKERVIFDTSQKLTITAKDGTKHKFCVNDFLVASQIADAPKLTEVLLTL